jgi:hypothetical protein
MKVPARELQEGDRIIGGYNVGYKVVDEPHVGEFDVGVLLRRFAEEGAITVTFSFDEEIEVERGT